MSKQLERKIAIFTSLCSVETEIKTERSRYCPINCNIIHKIPSWWCNIMFIFLTIKINNKLTTFCDSQILESSQLLLNMIKREATSLDQTLIKTSGIPTITSKTNK